MRLPLKVSTDPRLTSWDHHYSDCATGFYIAPDANSNEMILAEMKAAIAEQESVMKTQDDVLQCREERIKELEQGEP